MKKCEVPICDITLLSDDYFESSFSFESKSVSHSSCKNKNHHKSSRICLTETDEYESNYERYEDSYSSGTEELTTKKKKRRNASYSEDENDLKRRNDKKRPDRKRKNENVRRRIDYSDCEFYPPDRNENEYSSSSHSEDENDFKGRKVRKQPDRKRKSERVRRRIDRNKSKYSPSISYESGESSDVSYKSNENSDVSYEIDESSDITYESDESWPPRRKKKKKKVEKKEELSEYEKMVQRNRAEKLALLESLKINELKESLKKKRKTKG